jgi:hypothetical protein
MVASQRTVYASSRLAKLPPAQRPTTPRQNSQKSEIIWKASFGGCYASVSYIDYGYANLERESDVIRKVASDPDVE